MKKIIVFYASYGGGHLSAARSIKEYIEANYEDIDISLKIEDEYLKVTVYDNEVIDKQEKLEFPLTLKDLSIRQNKPVPMYVI